MNTDTGHIYVKPETIAAARKRHEPLMDVSPRLLGLSRKHRQKIGQAIANLKRTKPNLNDAERETLALKICKI